MNKLLMLIMSTLLFFITACGGSSDESPPPIIETPNPPPPTPTTAITSTTGVITGFGSVFVNGVEYETDTTHVSTDDQESANETDLEVGMVIILAGVINSDGTTGSAETIHYEEQIKGPLESIDLAVSTMTVMGQIIIFDDAVKLSTSCCLFHCLVCTL